MRNEYTLYITPSRKRNLSKVRTSVLRKREAPSEFEQMLTEENHKTDGNPQDLVNYSERRLR